MTAILTGVRVLDFGRYVAGPYCATLLGYLGADVIRVERREGGEDRYIAPVTAGGEGAVFFQTACNKRSLTLDIGKPGSREIVRRLIERADVVVANLPPSALRQCRPRLCLAHAHSSKHHPDHAERLRRCRPVRDRGGFDGVGQAMSGAMYITGVPGAPAKAAAPYVDYSTAVLAAFGTLAALFHREKTGEGQEVKGTLLGTALAVFNSHLIEQGVTAANRSGSGNRVQTSAPSDVFATGDGHILLHVVGTGLFRRWARLMGEEDRWLSDPAYATDQSRADNSERILARMREWCRQRTTAQALGELEKAGLAIGPRLQSAAGAR